MNYAFAFACTPSTESLSCSPPLHANDPPPPRKHSSRPARRYLCTKGRPRCLHAHINSGHVAGRPLTLEKSITSESRSEQGRGGRVWLRRRLLRPLRLPSALPTFWKEAASPLPSRPNGCLRRPARGAPGRGGRSHSGPRAWRCRGCGRRRPRVPLTLSSGAVASTAVLPVCLLASLRECHHLRCFTPCSLSLSLCPSLLVARSGASWHLFSQCKRPCGGQINAVDR